MLTQIRISLGLLLLCISVTKANNYLSEKPNFLTPCVVEDPNFNRCLAGNLQGMLVQFKDGLPGTNIVGPLDPLLVKRIKLSQNADAISVNADLQNVYITGASQIAVQEASYNPTKYVAKALVVLPKLRFDFDYKVKGHVLALNLNGHGKGGFQAENVVASFDMIVKPRTTAEGTFADVQRVKAHFRDVGNFNVKLYDLFGENAELDATAHMLFNGNWRQFFSILKPTLEQTFEAVLLDRTKKIFNYVPATYFIENFH
ncbi:uncharacterized protein LOC6563211 [Drosophila grimshawi]|uniref:GH18633 n=1 Tax=Drosophila grimshawi TaxID=7222 RepID=B4JHG1_DROGR|nr:uncharacterized protein LOC6563211 [Drosophila grimshawi]EDV92788.1 GH18633 [Drosophila grimshawi]